MTLLTNTYGDVAEIGKLTPRWSASGTFSTTTSPTLATVESWCDQVSGLINTILADKGFTIPITQADAKLMLDMFVNEEVAAMVEGGHGSGRFGPAALGQGGVNRFQLIRGDISKFVEDHAQGIERLGAARAQAGFAGIGYRDTDVSGDETHPIFEREGFGESYATKDPE